MNKTAIKNFAIWARNKLIADVSYDARLIGITEDGIAKPLSQSFGSTQFFDIGTAEPYSISGEAVYSASKARCCPATENLNVLALAATVTARNPRIRRSIS